MSEVKTHNCDCGFSWVHGMSGHHYCGEYYRQQIQELLRENLELKLSQDNVTAALGIKGEGAHSKLVIEYVHGLVAENAALKELIEQHAAGFVVCENCSHEEPCETDDIVALYRSTETPATDAFTAELRAQGVDEFTTRLGAKAAILSTSSNVYKVLKSIIFSGVEFAANLRAGRKG
ncbi:hypothetical protein [Rahnella sp. BCC 1045]|uniref:hypothetical protein n=1 Tax=Rahnella sp. BCC 1045 TaxID=2816251 RepID=UPI0020B7BE79|nr:hypothetical protein [Rahnella sp. BCC 1045]